LIFIRRVLVVAASAASEIGAGSSDALGRGIDDLESIGADEAGLFLARAGEDALARQDERREDNTPIEAREALAAVDQLLDRDFEVANDKELLPLPSKHE